MALEAKKCRSECTEKCFNPARLQASFIARRGEAISKIRGLLSVESRASLNRTSRLRRLGKSGMTRS